LCSNIEHARRAFSNFVLSFARDARRIVMLFSARGRAPTAFGPGFMTGVRYKRGVPFAALLRAVAADANTAQP